MNIRDMHYDIEEYENINEELILDKDSLERRYIDRLK